MSVLAIVLMLGAIYVGTQVGRDEKTDKGLQALSTLMFWGSWTALIVGFFIG